MNDPSAIEASKHQWRAYFDAGHRYDVPLDTRHLLTGGKLALKFLWRGNLEVLDAVSDVGEHQIGKLFFGDTPNPSLGVSNVGLHFPTVPTLPWTDIAAIILMNQASLMAQASNGYILEQPPVGNTSTVFRSDLAYISAMMIVTADGTKTQQQLVSNPAYADVVLVHPTPSGKRIGTIQTPLDPYVGPEQGVEYLFLLHLMARKHGVTMYHAESYPKMMGTFNTIREMN